MQSEYGVRLSRMSSSVRTSEPAGGGVVVHPVRVAITRKEKTSKRFMRKDSAWCPCCQFFINNMVIIMPSGAYCAGEGEPAGLGTYDAAGNCDDDRAALPFVMRPHGTTAFPPWGLQSQREFREEREIYCAFAAITR